MNNKAEDFKKKGEEAAKKHKEIQDELAKLESSSSEEKKSGDEKAMQAGARKYPEPPMPTKKLSKPGDEKDLTEQPMCDAPYYKGSEKLKDMVAIITGGDSGIGRSVAILFAREGADVAIVYLNEHEDAEETQRLVEKEGRTCLLIPGDVTDKEFCKYTVDQTMEKFGKVDILVNNSAFQLHVNNLEDLTEEHFDTTLKTNLYGYFHMAKATIPVMKYGSAIINTGSVTGIKGSKGLPDYAMTKGGIHAFTRSLGGKLIEKGIRVNAVAPGPVWTPLNPADQDKEKIKQFGAKTPMKRPAQPEELAPAYVFLASPQCSSYISGEILPVIGGYGH